MVRNHAQKSETASVLNQGNRGTLGTPWETQLDFSGLASRRSALYTANKPSRSLKGGLRLSITFPVQFGQLYWANPPQTNQCVDSGTVKEAHQGLRVHVCTHLQALAEVFPMSELQPFLPMDQK